MYRYNLSVTFKIQNYMKKKSLLKKLCRPSISEGVMLKQTVFSSLEDKNCSLVKDERSYEEVFLKRRNTCHRKQTYISSEAYSRLSLILPVIAEGISVPDFLDNILLHHWEIYGSKIEYLFKKKVDEVHF